VGRAQGLLRDHGMPAGDMPGTLCKVRPALALGAGRWADIRTGRGSA